MKLLDFLDAQKRIYAKLTPLTPKIQAHDPVTEIGTCLKKQVPIFLVVFPVSLSVRYLRPCFPLLTDRTFKSARAYKLKNNIALIVLKIIKNYIDKSAL